MVTNNMVEDVRQNVGLPSGSDGKPVGCYTNNSESINRVIKSKRDQFLQEHLAPS